MNAGKIGDQIEVLVSTTQKRFSGTIRFADDSFISVDQGNGITAILRFDPALNSWRMGKVGVAFKTASFSERLNALAKRVGVAVNA